MREAIEGRRSSRRVLTLMPMLPSGLTSGRSLCVEPATPMSARGWTRGTRARGNGEAGHARPAEKATFLGEPALARSS